MFKHKPPEEKDPIHGDFAKNAEIWKWFTNLYEFSIIYVPAIPECGYLDPIPLPPSDYWYEFLKDKDGFLHELILTLPHQDKNLWPRNTSQITISFNQSSYNFKTCINHWFNQMIVNQKVRRKDGKEIKKKQTYKDNLW